jgi:hypothetical protein
MEPNTEYKIKFDLGQQKRQYTIVCGEHELNNKKSYEVELKVTNVIVHPKYVTASQGYDIAIYQVNTKFIAIHII